MKKKGWGLGEGEGGVFGDLKKITETFPEYCQQDFYTSDPIPK